MVSSPASRTAEIYSRQRANSLYLFLSDHSLDSHYNGLRKDGITTLQDLEAFLSLKELPQDLLNSSPAHTLSSRSQNDVNLIKQLPLFTAADLWLLRDVVLANKFAHSDKIRKTCADPVRKKVFLDLDEGSRFPGFPQVDLETVDRYYRISAAER